MGTQERGDAAVVTTCPRKKRGGGSHSQWAGTLERGEVATLRRGGGVHSRERGRECRKEAAVCAALKDGELEAAARLLRAGRKRQRDAGER